MTIEIQFPVGFRSFHPDRMLNFQPNRFLAAGSEADFERAAAKIGDLADWKGEMLALAHAAEAEERLQHAAAYFRAAEFFMASDDSDRAHVYKRFVDLFGAVTRDEEYERFDTPYDGAALPTMRLPADKPKDTVLVHGGFDSFLEELYPLCRTIRDEGYDVIVFDGPGQGAALSEHGLTMTPEWERPVAAVIDHLGLESCSLLGLSLGGYLAPRAAAFEPRIRRVIAFDIMWDFLDCMLHDRASFAAAAVRALLRLPTDAMLNAVAERLRRSNIMTAWGLPQGMRVMGATTPAEFLQRASGYTTAGFSDRIEQDVLLLAGADDHYVPLRQLWQQAAALTNARSVTTRVFTEAEQAQNHCQVGNMGLALRVIVDWLDTCR